MFNPSKYQADFFAELLIGTGDIQLVAVAGSGKTKSIEEACKQLPRQIRQSTLLCAFNKHIETELTSRQKVGKIPSGIEIKTIHGLGYRILRDALRPKDPRSWVQADKYKNLADLAWRRLKLKPDTFFSKSCRAAQRATVDLAEYAMVSLTDAEDDLAELEDQFGVMYDLEWRDPVHKIVRQIIQDGAQGLAEPDKDTGRTFHPHEQISFTDMITLPVVLDLVKPSYDLIFVDESQDLNRAQQEFLLRLKGRGRGVFVGDPRQAIYAFCGADSAAFDRIQQVTEAKRLPLSICYRCPESVVRLAQAIVPEIECAPDAAEGDVRFSSFELILMGAAMHYKNPETRDRSFLILCRTNAPLVEAALELIGDGVPVKMIGRDFGAALAKTIEAITEQVGFNFDEFFDFADRWLARELLGLEQKPHTRKMAAALEDKKAAVCAVYRAAVRQRGSDVTKYDLLSYVDEVFSDKSAANAITLSSIHRAKGLEAEVVGILRCDLLPHPRATDQDIEQERNLAYVAITRSRDTLYMDGPTGFNLPIHGDEEDRFTPDGMNARDIGYEEEETGSWTPDGLCDPEDEPDDYEEDNNDD